MGMGDFASRLRRSDCSASLESGSRDGSPEHGTARASLASAGDEQTVARSAADWYERGCDLETEAVSRGLPELRERAAQAYDRALDRDPEHAGAHTNRGRLYHLAGQLDRAETCYRRAASLAPDEPVYWFNLGVLLQDRGTTHESILAYRLALMLDPTYRDAHFNLAGIFEAMGQERDAFRHLSTYRKLTGPMRPRRS